MRSIGATLLAATWLAVCAAGAAASSGPLPAEQLGIRPAGLAGMSHARRIIFSAFSVGRWAEEQAESEREFKEYDERLFERGFVQGVATRLEGQREGRLRREVVSWVTVFAEPAGADAEAAENAAELIRFAHAERYSLAGIPGAVASGHLDDHGRKGGFANISFVTGRCAAVVGNSLHRRAPSRLSAAPASLAAVALYRRLAPLCS